MEKDETIRWAIVSLAEMVGEMTKAIVAQVAHLTAEVEGEERALEWGETIVKRLDQQLARMTEWIV